MNFKDSKIHNNIEEQKFWNKPEVWEDDGDEWSESFGGTERLWSKLIYPRISEYLSGDILEIAPGHGRMSNKLIDHASNLYLIDMNQGCIDRCKERFVSKDNIFYFTNNGMSLDSISDDSIDFMFSWDSFVHMQKFVIENYLEEISKKLKVGGVGAIHHSNFHGGDDDYSFRNIQGRSNFSLELFKSICNDNGLEMVEQNLFKFNDLNDGLSIFRKKGYDMEIDTKLLVVSPHLSTGGMPQYLLKYLESIFSKFSEIKVVEFSNFSDQFVVQKEKIKRLVGEDNFISLGSFSDKDNTEIYRNNRFKLIGVINSYRPDTIYMAEFPECYEYVLPPHDLMTEIYKKDRPYKIVESTHSNSFDFKNKMYIPDEFIFCSDIHFERSKHIDIPKIKWEYPIENNIRPDRASTLESLGLDPRYTHILNVGLLSPNKNQKYIFDLAEKFIGKKVQFHFIGNTCFLNDCGIRDVGLKNCRIWQERKDVDKFMSCMDLFLFPSLKELNPITVKEALSWGMEVIANYDENYTDQYEDNEKFNILESIDVERIINNKIEQDSYDGKFLVVCSFYNNTKEHILRTFDNILNQTHKNWILIVGDDFSTNGCGEILKDEVNRINHPDILYYDVKFKRELHLCQNFFKTINYDYFVELDADDYVSNNLLEIYNNHFNKYSNVFSIFCDYDVVSEDGRLERISFIRNSDLDIDDEFYDRDSSSYMGIWKKYHSWNMYGHARCFRKSKRSRFLIDKNCKSSADTFSLFSCLQEGDHLLLPRDLYKLVNRKGSDSGSPMSQEEVLYYNTNSLLAIKEYSKKKQYKVLDLYEDIWLETSALSSSYLVKEKSDINLISDINEEQLSKIKDLYPDKIISVNDPTVNNVVVVWNKLDFHQRHSVLSILRDKSINFSIYNFIDSFDVSEEDMKEYLDNETNDLLGTVRKYIGGHSYFSYFRHVIISGRAI